MNVISTFSNPSRRSMLKLAAALTGSGVLAVGNAQQADFPKKVVKLISPAAAGGPSDSVARLLAGRFSEQWSQTVIVENKPGANGLIGSQFVAKSTADGHTLLLMYAGHVTNPQLRSKLSFDPMRDLTPVALVGTAPFVMAVPGSAPYKNLTEFVAYGRANPGTLTFGTSGAGSGAHLTGELLAQTAGIKLLHIPFKGASESVAAALAGNISMAIESVQPILPHLDSGKLKALAITSERRWPTAPNIPTSAESGLPGFVAETWLVMLTTAGTPKSTLDKLAADTTAALKQTEIHDRVMRFGIMPAGGTVEEAGRFVKAEYEKWGKVIRKAGITLE